MIFEFYDAAVAGTCVWSNSSATCATAVARTVTLTDGLFSENLGDTLDGTPYAAIADSVFGNNAGLYLQVTVGGETLSPRKQIVSAPYAMNADTLDGLDSTSFTSLFTDGGTFTYLTSATDDFVVGDTTVAGASLFFDESAGQLDLGTIATLDGSIRLYNSGAGAASTIATNIGGDIVLTSPNGSISLAASSAINIGGVLVDSADAINIATDGTSADTIIIGNSTAATTMALTGGDDWLMAATGVLTLSASAAQATALVVTDADYTDALSVGDNNIVGTTGAIDYTNFDVSSAGTINIAVNQGLDTNAAGALTIGGTNATSVTLCNSPACGSLAIGVSANANTISIGDVSDSITLASANWGITSGGVATFVGLYSNDFDRATAGVLTMGDTNATSLSLCNSAACDTIDIANSSDADTINIGLDATAGDVISIGNSNAATTLALTGGDSWSLDASGYLTLANGLLLSSPFFSAIQSSAATGFNFLDNVGDTTAIDIGGVTINLANTVSIATNGTSADTVSIGSEHAASVMNLKSGLISINDGLGIASAINIGTGAAFEDTIDIGNANASTLLSLTGGTSWSIATTGLITTADDLAVNGGDITSTAATFNFLDVATNSTTIDIGGVNADRGNTINIATNNTTGDTISIGNNSASTFTTITGGTSWVITSAGDITTSGVLAFNPPFSADITSTAATSFNILDAAGNTGAIDIGGVTNDVSNTIRIATNATSDDNIFIGNLNASTTLDVSAASMNTYATTYAVGEAVTAISISLGGVIADNVTAINIATNSTTADVINIGNTNAATTLSLAGIISMNTSGTDATTIGNISATTTVAITGGDDWSIDAGGVATFTDLFTNSVDRATAAALTIGNTNATSLSLCNSAACDTISIGTNADADTINIGNTNDYIALTGDIDVILDTSTNYDDNFSISHTNTADFSNSSFRVNYTDTAATSVNTNYLTELYNANDGGATGTPDGFILIEHNDPNETVDYGINMFALSPITTAIDVSDADIVTALSVGANDIIGTTGAINLTNFDVASTGVTSVNLNATATLFGICHSGADVNAATDTERDLVACSGAPGDYAEWYETDGSASAGDIVSSSAAIFTYQATQSNAYTGEILSGTVTKTLPILTKATSTNNDIFGIISSSPNQIIGTNVKDQGAHPEPIALVGRVPLHVTSENGPITAGDYLTISSTPGYAMKATAPGRVVGRALTNFSGVGMTTITVFIDNTWYGGEMLAADGSALSITGDLKLSALANATAIIQGQNSHALILAGSGWNGTSAVDVNMGLRTKVNSTTNYRVAVENNLGGEVASITNSGDILVSGKLYPSDRGLTQTDAYIYYDSSAGGGYMKTNAAGWNVGSYDFAEMFPSDEVLNAGEVVVFADHSQGVKKSGTTKYDNMLVGVVSTRPGFLAGEYKEGSYPVALSGRVPTNVSDENGAVAIGDPLTTSSTPGVAMKATMAGPILGYAMEPLSSGTNKIVAFIRASYYSGSGTNASPAVSNTVSSITTSNGLDLSGALNMNGGNILSVGSIEGIGGAWKIAENGDFMTQGAVVKQVRSFAGDLVNTYPAMTTERTVELSGTSTLQNGTATVTFSDVDAHFNQIISSTASYRVLVTPAGATGQIYVTDRSNGGFVIHDTGNSNGITVDWLVIAYEKDHEPQLVIPAPAPLPADPAPVTEPEPAVAGTTDPAPVDPSVVAPTGEPAPSEPPVDSAPVDPTVVDPAPPIDSTAPADPPVDATVDPSGVAPTGEPAPVDTTTL